MSAAPDFLFIKDELDRKILETLTWLEKSREGGQITEDMRQFGQSIVYQIAAGLMDNDIKAALDAEGNTRPERTRDLRMMRRDRDLVLVSRRCNAASVATVRVKLDGKNFRASKFNDTNAVVGIAKASQHQDRVVAKLTALGFKEI